MNSLAGIPCIQEVDRVHSNIEKAMNKTDFYSPLGILKQVNSRHPYRLIKMRSCDFNYFQGTAKLLNYKIVPFSSVAVLKYIRNLHVVKFKISHNKFEPENFANTVERCKSGIIGTSAIPDFG
ncbi:hypothetical protein AVEN_76299-1 [Araneus ventricosus]|uniref:Uncharacterized protein n=1 Tax=Araneus ventricosus TaxID=182803 RepID=A0A4Y2ABZ2_ARAVE|nr:hypothetical protein AVEN_76299-1 [Araneus ventricosus]